MRRTVWLLTGVAIGAGGTLWAEQRLRRTVRQAADRLTPDHVVAETLEGARRLGDRLGAARGAGRRAAQDREEELWQELAARRPVVPAGIAAAPRAGVVGEGVGWTRR